MTRLQRSEIVPRANPGRTNVLIVPCFREPSVATYGDRFRQGANASQAERIPVSAVRIAGGGMGSATRVACG